MSFNMDLVASAFPLLLMGALVTIKITALSVGCGVIIGLFVGIARICNLRILRILRAKTPHISHADSADTEKICVICVP